MKSDSVFSVGNRIGVGKEADIVLVASPSPASRQLVLKIHRLGRISFRTVKTNRDYLRNRHTGNWMYLSRLAAMKEYAVLSALYDTNFPVPQPVTSNRHTVLMSLVEGTPLRSVSEVPDPAALYGQLIELILRLASYGLIHGDFNEFNILIEEIPTKPTGDDEQPGVTLRPIIIDFPQTVSTTHMNAKYYFDRDVNCIKRFFQRRFGFTSDEPGPFFEDALKNQNQNSRRLDIEVEASGFSRKMAAELQKYIEATEGERNEANNEEGEYLNDDEDDEGGDGEDQSDAEITKLDKSEVDNQKIHIQESESIETGIEKLALASETIEATEPIEFNDTASIAPSIAPSAFSTRSRRFVNPVKASRGWAI